MSIRVLFVDDEERILNGLRRTMMMFSDEFTPYFAGGGEEALQVLSETGNIDVIVSDMRMPGMNGAQLLNKVKKEHPGIARIIMSGHSDKEMVLESVGPTHQYLAKPCSPDVLRERLHEIVAIKPYLKNKGLQSLLSSINSLPSLPSIYHQLVDELNSEDGSVKRVGKIIATDPAMTAKILKLVNSAYFGVGNQVSSPSVAASLLGMETMKTLVLTLHVFSEFDGALEDQAVVQNLLRHSLAVGACARTVISRFAPDSSDNVYTAGLLHDFGKVVLASHFPDSYMKVLKRLEDDEMDCWEAEFLEFKTSHAEVAAYIYSLWGLPEAVVEAVAFHHYPSKAPRISPELLALHAANARYKAFSTQTNKRNEMRLDESFLASNQIMNTFISAAENCEE